MKAWIPVLLTILMLPLLASGAAMGPTTADVAVQYVSPNGNDGNDGLSWATAKANIATAEISLPPCSFGNHCGTVYVGPGSYTLMNELDIGDSSGSPIVVNLIGSMTVKMEVSGSSSCSIKQWPNSVIEGAGKGGGGLAGRILFQAVAGFSPYAFYCTNLDDSVPRGYYSASGFMIQNLAGVATASGYAAVFANIVDDSRFSEIHVTDGTNNVAWVWHACCGATFLDDSFWANATGGVALTVGPGLNARPTDQDMGVTFIGMSLTHSRPSSNALVIQEPKNNGGSLNFYGTYIEGSRTAHTVPFIEIKSADYGVYFHGLHVEAITPETVYAMHIAKGAAVRVSVSGMIFVTANDQNAIKNDKNGQTVVANTIIPDYVYLNNNGGGIVAHLGPNGISAGTITLLGGSGSHTFSRPYSNPPVCTATDNTSASPVQVTSTRTSITVTVAGTIGTGPGTGSDKVAWICVPGAK